MKVLSINGQEHRVDAPHHMGSPVARNAAEKPPWRTTGAK
jgi:hypothetical protein